MIGTAETHGGGKLSRFETLHDYDRKMDRYYFDRRAELLKEVLEDLDKNKKILDFGCGTGNFIQFIEGEGYKNIFGFDITSTLLKIASKKGIKDLVLADGGKLPYKERFDLIVMPDVIEHLPDPFSALHEACRILKKNGTVFITYPNPNFVPILNLLSRIGAKVKTKEKKVDLDALIHHTSDCFEVMRCNTILLGAKLPRSLLNLLEGIETILPQKIRREICLTHVLVLRKTMS